MCVCVSVFFSCIPEILELEFIGLWVSIATLSAQATLMFFFWCNVERSAITFARCTQNSQRASTASHSGYIHTHSHESKYIDTLNISCRYRYMHSSEAHRMRYATRGWGTERRIEHSREGEGGQMHAWNGQETGSGSLRLRRHSNCCCCCCCCRKKGIKKCWLNCLNAQSWHSCQSNSAGAAAAINLLPSLPPLERALSVSLYVPLNASAAVTASAAVSASASVSVSVVAVSFSQSLCSLQNTKIQTAYIHT